MSQKEYIKALNDEIRKLNGVIDIKIVHQMNYRREARRHRKLLAKLRREESQRLFGRMVRMLIPRFF